LNWKQHLLSKISKRLLLNFFPLFDFENIIPVSRKKTRNESTEPAQVANSG
jgi:hypothetical protein